MSQASHAPPGNDLDGLACQLESLRGELMQQADLILARHPELPAHRRQSAENLVHYLALRNHDLRPLQNQLAHQGLSSLGRAEPHVMAAIDAVLRNIYRLSAAPGAESDLAGDGNAFEHGIDQLETNTLGLLGARPEGRQTFIMVTMPAEAADDYMMLYRLLDSGMNCMRINCAHDDQETWLRMINRMHDAERATGRTCRILMDLGGPKLRTGPMQLLPPVKKIRPLRDSFGRVLRHARIWLTAEDSTCDAVQAADACLIVDPDWLAECRAGNQVLLRDARDSNRRWRIREVTPEGCWVDADKTTYVSNETVLRLRGLHRITPVGALPRVQNKIRVRNDDVLLIVNSDKPGQPALHDDNGELLSPGRVSLPIPEIYRDTRRGDPVCFDDGRITGVIEKKNSDQLQVRITHTRKPVESLGGDKGVNFPATRLGLPAMGEKDLRNLEFVVKHADMVGLSFTNCAEDVQILRRHLAGLAANDIGVVLKIETRWGFSNLPELLLEAMKCNSFGVMIARGDLAVECGFERLAEVQQEMLWICEAAHAPVIWATQVLEGLARQGHASRAEITDAAASQAAECVMLNKGPHVDAAVQTLDNVLQRMQNHQHKKTPLLRKLQVAAKFSKQT
jgi:pyruvate kinase